MVEWMDEKCLNAITKRLLGPPPNTYTYTKRLAEMIAVDMGDKIPLIITRPMVGRKGILKSRIVDGDSVPEVIPVDFAINNVICCGYERAKTKKQIDGAENVFWRVSAHNYFHLADNFRMFYFQLGFQSVKEWRVSHALSHHLFPNTIIDMEMHIFEPLATYFPKIKSFLKRYLPCFFLRLREFFKYNKKEFNISDLIPFSLPIFLVTFSNQPVITCFYFWTCIILSDSFIFATIGTNAAHHAPDIFHDGDAARDEKDFGIAQLDAVIDREEILGSHLWTLTTFGQHALHHLFPTIDHGLLKFIYQVFEETMNEFGVGLRLSNSFKLMKGQFRQIAKVEPNLIPPGLDLIKNK
nr:cytochrome b5-related protein-like [Onthophagus taurus]